MGRRLADDAEGQIATWTQQTNAGPAKVYEFGYDAVNQLLSAVLKTTGAGASVLKKYAYTYDDAGNRTGEQIDGYPSQAAHNNLNQLTSIAGGGPVRFRGYLSETGSVTVAATPATMSSGTNFSSRASTVIGTNVVTVVATDVSTNRATNTYTVIVTNGVVSRSLAYDLVGNLLTNATSFSTNTYAWDAANRLVKITQALTNTPLRVTEFTYDGLGRRVRQIEKTNGVEQSNITFLWCGAELCEERSSTGGTITKRFFGQGEQISGVNYFFIRDHLGSVREMTDTSSAIRARYDYDPYGRRTKVHGDLEADFGFTGHYVHQASGLNLALYRAYDAETGRWLSRDAIEEQGGPNLYGYVGNDPITRVDPLGLAWYDGLAALFGLGGQGTFAASWAGFAEGWSRGGAGALNLLAGGLFNSKDSLTYDYFDQLSKDAWGAGNDCDENFKFGSNAGRVAEGALLAAGAAWGWTAAGLPTMSIGWASPGGSIHFFWSVTTTEGTVVLHSVGVSSTTGGIWAGYLGGGTAITAIPILFPGAAAAVGIAGYNCLTGACGALRRSLFGF